MALADRDYHRGPQGPRHDPAPDPYRLTSGYLWLKCAAFAIIGALPGLLLLPIWQAGGRWGAAVGYLVTLTFSLLLSAADDQPV